MEKDKQPPTSLTPSQVRSKDVGGSLSFPVKSLRVHYGFIKLNINKNLPHFLINIKRISLNFFTNPL